MLHLLQLRYTGSEEDAAPLVGDHVAWLEQHHATGTFLVSGQTVPTEDGGAIIALGVDRDTLTRIAARDPFVVGGVASYTITSITPGRVHPALAALLTSDQ